MEQKCETHKTDLCKCYENYCVSMSVANQIAGTGYDRVPTRDVKIDLMSNAIESMFKCGLNYRKEMEAKFAKLERKLIEQQNQFTLYVEHSREQACS